MPQDRHKAHDKFFKVTFGQKQIAESYIRQVYRIFIYKFKL